LAARGVQEGHNTGMGGVRGFVGVTDNGWYRLLADRPDLLGEVNFWRPGGGGFRALRPGEPFFFKTHAPYNRVVGGGFFGGAVRLPASEAWDLLGPANGAASRQPGADGGPDRALPP
jgi:putative restriction endonuclease